MTPEHERRIIMLAPNLFPHEGMLFECDDGWYPLFECDDGWYPIIAQLTHEIWEVAKQYPVQDRPHVVQVKETMGGLRYYMDGFAPSPVWKPVHELIHAAEEKSLRTCELCASPGTLRKLGWLRKTLCNKCYVAAKLMRAP